MAIRRWRRYGKDRLYVTDGANNRLGWHDLLTGQTSYDDPTTTFVVDEEVAEWRLREAGTAPEPELRSAPSPHPSPEARSKPIDLAINRPGTAPAARAKELQQLAADVNDLLKEYEAIDIGDPYQIQNVGYTFLTSQGQISGLETSLTAWKLHALSESEWQNLGAVGYRDVESGKSLSELMSVASNQSGTDQGRWPTFVS